MLADKPADKLPPLYPNTSVWHDKLGSFDPHCPDSTCAIADCLDDQQGTGEELGQVVSIITRVIDVTRQIEAKQPPPVKVRAVSTTVEGSLSQTYSVANLMIQATDPATLNRCWLIIFLCCQNM